MQGYLQTNLIVYLSQGVGFIGVMSVVALVVGFIGVMSFVSFVVGFIGAMSMVALVVGFIGQCWRECRRHGTPAEPRVE